MPLDLDAIRARRERWLAAANMPDMPVPNRILLIGASANDVPPLLDEVEQLRATVEQQRADLSNANTMLTTAVQAWRVAAHERHSGPLDTCQRDVCTALQGYIPRRHRPNRTGA